MISRFARSLGTLALLPLFGLVFWGAATVASNLPGLVAVAVNVHGLGLVSYAGTSRLRPAPVSGQVSQDAQRDANGGRSWSAPTPLPTPMPVPTPTALLVPTPTSAPVPVPAPTPVPLPVSTPTPVPLPAPTPTPAPSLLPLPLPVPVPTLPSLLPGLLK